MPSVTCRKARVNSNMKHIIFYNYVSLEIYSAQSPEVFGWGKKKKQTKTTNQNQPNKKQQQQTQFRLLPKKCKALIYP